MVRVAGKADVARQHYYDRNPQLRIPTKYDNFAAGTGWTQQNIYTVPAGKKAMNGTVYAYIGTAKATAGRTVGICLLVSTDGGSTYNVVTGTYLKDGEPEPLTVSITAIFNLKAGDIIAAGWINADTVAHYMVVNDLLTEFDA